MSSMVIYTEYKRQSLEMRLGANNNYYNTYVYCQYELLDGNKSFHQRIPQVRLLSQLGPTNA